MYLFRMSDFITFILINLFSGFFASKITRFTKSVSYQDLNCSSEHTVFKDENVESNLVCLLKCLTFQSCFGTFYNKGTKDCTGCHFYMDEDAPVHSGNLFYRRKGYQLIEETKNWTEAKDYCIALGGHLAYIKSIQEQLFVEMLLTQADLGNNRVWIGASDTAKEGTFVWADGSLCSDTFTYWGNKQPNNYNNNQNCVSLFLENGLWRWNDEACDAMYFSLCEYN